MSNETQPLVYFCQNPECNRKIDEEKYKYQPKHCSKKCQLRHAELNRPICASPTCDKHVPFPKQKFCSDECYMDVHFIARNICANADCSNICGRAYQKYCTFGCAVANGEMKKNSLKGREAIIKYKQEHGRIPGYEKIAAAVSKGNKETHPKLRVTRYDIVYGYDAIFIANDTGGYDVSLVEYPTIAASGRTKREAKDALRQIMRHQI